MARIKQLPLHEAQKIAAGEVVDRPANVVKELVENAIDAGATHITLHIIDGGKELIRVIDNGCGMSPEDARLCFLHHATSKITSVHDLSSINTFGFRGEALSSISAVSHVTLLTNEDGIEGTKLVLHAGVIESESVVPCVQGTDITVEQLFYNMPARKKFLKTRDTEWRQIVHLFQAFVLDYQSIHFKMYSEGSELYNCPPTQHVSQRFAQLWDATLAQSLIEVSGQNSAYKVHVRGLISNHQYYRYDRSCMYFFVNNRWVKNIALTKALTKGYLNVIPADRYPAVCLFITIDPHEVDINIHPRKEEVQFLHPRSVETLVTQVVKNGLERHLSEQIGKEVTFYQEKKPISYSPDMPFSMPLSMQTPSFEIDAPFMPIQTVSTTPVVQAASLGIQEQLFSNNEPSNQSHMPQEITPILGNYTVLGQFNKTYILIEQEQGLFLVDQHAAHERILYEKFANRFENNQPVALLFPIMVTVALDDLDILASHYYLFSENGIMWQQIGQNQIAISSLPVHAKEIDVQELIHQTIGWLKEYKQVDKDNFQKIIHEKLHAQMACKAAVKAGDILTMAHMEQLLADLMQTPNRFTCPHGRPTGWLLSLNEIERKFKRKL
ncbi:DNA mismatch repair protein HexB [Candidatus Dependentiae bacterium Noda2021]|nr:DNA mismatch repair protein HexB [Candidatus Dependentiae bacterium Noda2021]